uniref:Uncharacterized protein n=1 Tax=Arundo donax TaxID=35708 RepID=A0A0A8Y755_ARUDO
MLLGASSVSV